MSQTPRPEAAPGRIKGAAFREFVAWYEQELGRAQLLTLVRAIPDDLRRGLELDPDRESLGILSSRWYRADAIHALLDAVIAGIDPDQRRESIERAADAVMRATLRGVYRILFEWLATPDRYARFADRLWRSYYDSGEMHVVQETPERAVCTIRDWGSHSAQLCDMNAAAAGSIYRAMGCTEVVARRTSCVAQGADECRFVTTWARAKPR